MTRPLSASAPRDMLDRITHRTQQRAAADEGRAGKQEGTDGQEERGDDRDDRTGHEPPADDADAARLGDFGPEGVAAAAPAPSMSVESTLEPELGLCCRDRSRLTNCEPLPDCERGSGAGTVDGSGGLDDGSGCGACENAVETLTAPVGVGVGIGVHPGLAADGAIQSGPSPDASCARYSSSTGFVFRSTDDRYSDRGFVNTAVHTRAATASFHSHYSRVPLPHPHYRCSIKGTTHTHAQRETDTRTHAVMDSDDPNLWNRHATARRVRAEPCCCEPSAAAAGRCLVCRPR